MTVQPLFPRHRATPVAGLLLVGVLLGGCGGRAAVGGAGEGVTIEEIRDQFERERYTGAIESAQAFLSANPGSRHLEEAVFLLGRAYYEEGEYLEAEDRFRRLLRDFPNSEYAEESSYTLGLALLSQARGPELDQSETHAAHVQFRDLLSRFPDSEFAERARGHIAGIRSRLAEKAFKNGSTYTKLGRHEAARFYYLERVYTPYPETGWAARALVRISKSYKDQDDASWDKVAEWAGRAIAEYPDTEPAARAAELLEEARKHLGSAFEREAGATAADSDD